MDSGFSNMLENTRKYFQGIPTDAAAAAAAAAAQMHFPPPLSHSHHLHHNGGGLGGGGGGGGGGRTSMTSSSEPSSAAATDRFAGYHHPHLRYTYQPYSSPGHYPRTAVDPKPAAFQHHHPHFQPPTLQYHHQLPPSTASSPLSPYKSSFQLHQQQPPPPAAAVKQTASTNAASRSSSPQPQPPPSPAGKQYGSPLKPPPPRSPYAVPSKSTAGAPPPQSSFTAPKEQQPPVPQTPPSPHHFGRTTHGSAQQQQTIDRDYLRFKPIQTPPPQPNRFQPLERPKSELPAGAGSGQQSSHLAIRYDPKLEQPRSGVRAVPIAQAKQSSSSSYDVNRVIVQKPEPLRYHHQQSQQQQQGGGPNHRSSSSTDDHHHHKRPASVQPSYLDSRPFQIKPYDGGAANGNSNSNGSSSNGSSTGSGGQQTASSSSAASSSSYHRPFAVAPSAPGAQTSAAAVVVTGMDHHRWNVFGRQDGRPLPSFLPQQQQQQQQQTATSAAAVINGYHHHPSRQPHSSSLPAVVTSQHHQLQHLSTSSRQQQQQQQQQQQPQHYPLNLHKIPQPARPATAAGQLQQIKIGTENSPTATSPPKMRFDVKRESPLDLSVKTVCRSADSTDDRLNPFGHDIPKVNFKPDFTVGRGASTSTSQQQPPSSAAVVVVGGQPLQQHHHHNAAAAYHHQLPPVVASPQPLSSSTVLPTPLPPIVPHQAQLPQPQPPPSSSQVLSSVDEAWRAAIDRQIEQKFNLYTSSKKHQCPPVPPAAQHHQHHSSQLPPTLQLQQPVPVPPSPQQLHQQQPQQQGPAQADKRVLEILKHNIEARDQSSRPQIAEAPSTPAMVFSTPIRKEPSTTPLKKTDYYMAERKAVTPFPKKIDYYMERAYCNAPRIRTKAERKQVSAEGSSSGMRMSSPMAAATAISPHPFLPSNNGAVPQTKQEQTPLTQPEAVTDLKLDIIKREPSPIKDPCMLTDENTEKEDDDDFWLKTCDSFVVQLAETQEKKIKSPIKRKLLKEQLPQPPKRKYTKRIKVELMSESENDKKVPVSADSTSKPAESINIEKLPAQESKTVSEEKPIKAELLDVDKENKTKAEDREKMADVENNEKQSTKVTKPKRKRVLKLKFPKPILITKMNKTKLKERKALKLKEKKEEAKEEKKESKRGEKTTKKELLLQQQKSEKTKDAVVAKEEKKGLKKEEKRDLKKEQQQPESSGSAGKKDPGQKKEGKKAEANRKKAAAEKENVAKNSENTTRRAAAAAAAANIMESTANKFNPRQSLRRKNSLKDYTFAFDELLDDAFVHFEVDKVPVRRKRKCASPSLGCAPSATVTSSSAGSSSAADAAVASTSASTSASASSSSSSSAAPAAVKRSGRDKGVDNETIRMRLRSRNRPLQEPQQAAKKKGGAKLKIVPKRRRKKSLGEKSAAAPAPAADDWKDELYKFKRSLRLPSKLISVVSPPSAGAVAPDQVSLTSIMNIPAPPKLVKETAVKPSAQSLKDGGKKAAAAATAKQRLGHLFGRRDVFKNRRLMKREKIVSAEKLMQRNRRKRRRREGAAKKGEEEGGAAVGEDDDDGDGDENENEDDDDEDVGKAPSRVTFRRKFMRKKFRSGFDYIKKKKKKEPASSEKKPAAGTVASAAAAQPQPKCCKPRYVSEIQADIKAWIVNKGHGETVLHRAARLGVKDIVGYCIEKLEYAPSVADNAGYTPLHEACSQGHYHIAKLLLQFGADVSASAQGGIRPLHEAVENGDVHLVRLLLSYGADPRLPTYSGQSPLSLAADRQTRMLLEHHVNDIQGNGNASVWNFDDTALNREPEDVDRLLWCSPPASSSSASPTLADDGQSYEFEFADHSLPDVYQLRADDGAAANADAAADDGWVLFADVSAALAVKTADALAKLLDDKDAVTAMSAERFRERAVLRKTLDRQPAAVVGGKGGNKSAVGDDKPSAAAVQQQQPSAAAAEGVATTECNNSSGEQIVLVRYGRKLKQLLGVDAYTVS